MGKYVLSSLAMLLLITGCSSTPKNTGAATAGGSLMLNKPYKTDRYFCLAHAAESRSVANSSMIQAAYRSCMFDRGYTAHELRETTSPYF